jgi:hypothetical protein
VVRNDPYVGLANRWFQPLTHLSNLTTFLGRDCKYKYFYIICKLFADIQEIALPLYIAQCGDADAYLRAEGFP